MNEVYREKINFYKLLLTIFTTAFYGCVSWCLLNIDNVISSKLLVCFFISVVIFISIAVVIKKIRFYINKMGEK